MEEFKRTERHQQAFDQIKAALSSDAILRHPDSRKPFILDTDASDIGMGAILSQVDEGARERPVMIESRKFSPAEAKWHIREKEALGIIFGLERFRPLLLGSKFHVRTDHSSLKWLLEAKSGRLQR